MNPVSLVIALAALVVLAGLSLLANRRLRHLQRLPMQWGLTGRVIWSAPRRLALALTAAHLEHLWLAGRPAARSQP